MGKEIRGKSPILLGSALPRGVSKELKALLEGTRKISKDQRKFSKKKKSKHPMAK